MIKDFVLPSFEIILLKIKVLKSSIAFSLNIFFIKSDTLSNSAITCAVSFPDLISEVSVFPPSAKFKASIKILLPAPVSPVKIFKPFEKEIDNFSINTILEM